ncbi:MAG: hypothetical protein HOG12_20110 [Alphaproteobacteria bacterium]|nr:hypothetical protein [Alphaproteobacteria bacterium]
MARATETTRSRSLGTYYVEVHRSDGKIVATLTGTGFITGDKHDLDSDKYQPIQKN